MSNPIDGPHLDRRSLLGVGGATLLAAASPVPVRAASSPTRKSFPHGFRWGASTAGYQIEGNQTNADLWLMEQVQPSAYAERSGDACDSYHRYEQDIALLKAIGLNSYRFSVEWSRIEPVRGEFSHAELDHYRRMIAALRKAGIDPVVTLFHVAAPRWFAEAGGWLNPESPDLFARYCDKVARELGDGMAFACTINEPQVGLTFRAFSPGYFKAKDEIQARAHAEAARRSGTTQYVTMDHPDIVGMTPQLLSAHHKGFAAIKAARPNLPTGVTLNLVDFEPGNAESSHLAMREKAYGAWMDAAKQSGDFVGVQTYRQIPIPGAGAKMPPLPEMPFTDPKAMGEMIKQPSALRNMVEYAHQRTGKPVFVTENGLETDDDRRRAWYIPQVLAGLHQAIESGLPVIGYMHWSLIDNFEWLQGYKPHFGLASVDRTTFERKLKPSAAVYGRIARSGRI
ncbi:family 1 glycosylhydrolase [Novosphingobium sp.]|uniref:glycoside hydrolase family 1 protein n=1 Tax=Novosphingobium sp. TaxID=1874826 RepID=UPI0025ECF639|nr:family 1 glycosylhydrolase [Novosphingobium sp.]